MKVLTRTMTKRERQVLCFIRRYFDRFGWAPSYRDIGKGIGLQSVGDVHRYLHRLEALGFLFLGGNPRQIQVVDVEVEDKPCPLCWDHDCPNPAKCVCEPDSGFAAYHPRCDFDYFRVGA